MSFPPLFFVCFLFPKKDVQILSIIYTLQLTEGTRARAKSLSLSFFLSFSLRRRPTTTACFSASSLSLVRILERRPRLLRKIFEFTNRCSLSNSLQFCVRTDAQQRKTKILHSPLLEHGRRRDQSNELDHPVVAPRSVHGVSDAGAPMMQSSSSSSLSSCVRNVFSKAVVFEKSKSPCRKDQKRPKKTKRSRRFDFFAEKVLLLWKRRRPVVFSSRFSNQQNFFPFFFFFFRNNTRKK